MFDKSFFPTPVKLLDIMFSKIKLSKITSVLEPSAGKGNIIKYLKLKETKWDKFEIEAIELNEELRGFLKGAGIKVVHDDFLTFGTFRSYDLIVQNPPFDMGVIHLLKAIEIQQRSGGQIVSVLNAQSLKNPHTKDAQKLLMLLKEYDATVEFFEDMFVDAERKTDVEVAVVWINIPKRKTKSIIMDNIMKDPAFEREPIFKNHLVSSNEIESLIEKYNFEIAMTTSLINEFREMKYLCGDLSGVNGYELKMGFYNDNTDVTTVVKSIRLKYWEKLFNSDALSKALTNEMRCTYVANIKEMVDYEFSPFNVQTISQNLLNSIQSMIGDTIYKLFEEFTTKHAYYDETSKNIHYYDGWKTNKAYKINPKVIIPFNGYDMNKLDLDYHVLQKFQDMEKAMDYLAGVKTDTSYMDDLLKKHTEEQNSKGITFKYFTVDFFKKRTVHIKFSDLEILKKLNIYGSKKKNWLPPVYGKSRYKDLNFEEKQIIDSFEGKASYEEVLRNPELYLPRENMLLLA